MRSRVKTRSIYIGSIFFEFVQKYQEFLRKKNGVVSVSAVGVLHDEIMGQKYNDFVLMSEFEHSILALVSTIFQTQIQICYAQTQTHSDGCQS